MIGIDLSAMDTSKNGRGMEYLSPDWQKMSKRIQIATIRLSECNRVDGSGSRNMDEALAVGIKRVPYFWPAPEKKRDWAREDAQAFLDNYIPGEREPMIDLEDTRYIKAWAGFGRDLRRAVQTIEDKLSLRPLFYSGQSYILQYFQPADWEWLIDYRFVFAQYGWQDYKTLLSAPELPQPMTRDNLAAWQFTMKAPGALYGFGTAVKSVALYQWYQ